MKKILLVLLLLTYFFCTGQEILTYRNKNEDYSFRISQDEYYVTFNSRNRESIEHIAEKFTNLRDGTALIKTQATTLDFNSRRTDLSIEFNNQLQKIEPVLIWEDGTRQICNGQLIVKLKNKNVLNEILKAWEFTATPDQFVADQYLVKVENISTEQLFSAVSQLARHKDVEFAEPDFITFTKLYTTDPYFSSQWSINNAGYLGGTVDADMDVDDAWLLSTGQSIKIAIVDIGVDLTHPDLSGNLFSMGYDATGYFTDGRYEFNDYHGTACAGIAAAAGNNNTGIAGVAYNSKIIPVRIGYSDQGGTFISSNSWKASGINWAVTNGADIISCSWGQGSSSTSVTNAIDNAVTNGRNINGVKKGCLVFFATGNNNGSVSYPATLPNVIAVGASSTCDQRKNPASCDGENWGSNFGSELDVVAPGVKVYATDIHGLPGYGSGDYRADFSGTSAACPNAAGVAALILSANPNLTYAQARQILESKTDKPTGYTYAAGSSAHPNGTWNTEVGYGRLNANKAVIAAVGSNAITGGANLLCTNNATYTLTNPPAGATITWQASPSSLFTVSSGTGITATLSAASATVSGQGTITFFVTGTTATISRTFWVGLPSTNISAVYNSSHNWVTFDPASPSTGATYSWVIDGVTYPYGNAIHPLPACGGSPYITTYTFEATLTATNSCGTSTRCQQFKFTCVPSKTFTSLGICGAVDPPPCDPSIVAYEVSPNPANSQINVAIVPPCESITADNSANGRISSPDEAENKSQEDVGTQSVILYDLQGQKRYSEVFTNKKNFNIDVSSLSQGIYILRISTDKQIEQRRIVINK